VIERGVAARLLLSDDTFNRVMQAVAAEQEQIILSSDYHETKKRESAYYQHKGFQAICATLVAWVQMGELAQEEVEVENGNTEGTDPV
jgi:hypothetical protein